MWNIGIPTWNNIKENLPCNGEGQCENYWQIPHKNKNIVLLGENTLQWSKIVVTNTTFWHYVFLNFYQTNIKKVFRKWYLE
jgi:hypothetical protein